MNKPTYQAAVVIGRWQLPHAGHEDVLRTALSVAGQVILVIGSAFRSRDSRNPFSGPERRQMLELMLGADAARVTFVPVRDFYDDERWARVVTEEVQQRVPHGQRVCLVGFRKDATSAYLNHFPQWTEVPVTPAHDIDATALRRVYFESDEPEAALQVLAPFVCAPVRAYLQAWSLLPAYARRCREARTVSAYRKRWTASFYLTADAVVRAQDCVLLIQRGGDVGHGQWALPGGFVNPHERFFTASLRELKEETSLALLTSTLTHALRGDAVFDHPLRSPRGGLVTRAFYFDLGQIPLPEVHAADDAQAVRWVPITELPALEEQLFEDHACILDRFVGLQARPGSGEGKAPHCG